MQKLKNKTLAILIALLLTTSMFALFVLPTANAHSPAWQIPTHAYITVAPNPIGVGQQTWIDMFLGNAPIPSSAMTNTYRFHNYQLIITAPDGTNTTQTWATVQDTTDNQNAPFTPNQVGTYTLTFNYGGQTLTAADQPAGSAYVNDTYLPSSNTCTLTVQQEPLPALITSTLPYPQDYWTRPIYGTNTDWWSISSNWLGTGSPVSSAVGSGYITGFGNSMVERFPGDAVGSLTSHVMWTYPIEEGGVVGGNSVTIPGGGYFGGTAYQMRFCNPIIIFGRIFYTMSIGMTGVTAGQTVCQDLRTGQIIWSRSDVPALSFGYVYDFETPNEHGVLGGVLFTANFARAFDAFTGDPMYNVTGVPTGIAALGPSGEHLRYVVTNVGTTTSPDWYLAQWNSSKTIPSSPTGMVGGIMTANQTIDASTAARYDWNVSIPWLNVMGNETLSTVTYTNGATTVVKGYSATGSNPDASNPSTQVYAFYGDKLICRNGSLPGLTSWIPYTYFAVNINASKGQLGSVQWWNTVQPPAGNITITNGPVDPTVGVFTEGYKETMQWVGFSMTTGKQVWGPTIGSNPLDYFGNPIQPYNTGQAAYGKLYTMGMGGELFCWDMTTGNLKWTYGNGGYPGNDTDSYGYVPIGPYPTFVQAVGNGVIYLATTEHTMETPIVKGCLARAINATDGNEIWTLSAYTGEFSIIPYVIADGFTAYYNSYDGSVYSLGRGPSSTTVTAPDAGLTFGQSVVIKGTVTDISAGTTQNQQAANFPNGVPCASDAIMKDWMGYVYQQMPFPTNFTGVPVTVYILDSNGNYRSIGTTTTTSAGTYRLTWTPDISGTYTVIAIFAGTNGYWGSSAQNAFDVMQVEPTASPYPVTVLPPTEMYITAGVAAIIVAIAIGFAITILVLRKRP